jgi:BirA family biotin operon repressor/biotin-[acetyl-CoA-carboxylase] ligase
MSTHFEIVRILADGRFHSGQELADAFGVSRTAVWKQFEKIRDLLGLDVYAVKGRGYRLPRPLELLDRAEMDRHLTQDERRLISRFEIHDQIDSTNSYLMERAVEGAGSGSVCIAEQQVAGRGRRGRRWVSPYGHNIYLSILWRYPSGPAGLSGLSLVAGIAVVQALRELGVEGVGLKWPNDVLHDHRKLAGLLLEVAGEQGGPSRVVLGLGLNTKLTPVDGEAIDQPWVDLSSVPGGGNLSRNRLAAVLTARLLESMHRFAEKGLAPLLEEWSRYDLYYQKKVVLHMGNQRIEGVHSGIDANGAIVIRTGEGERTFHGGEVSLRKACS